MIRFLVLYPEPTDTDAFDRHYFEVHVPLVKQLPGMRSYAVSRNASAIRGGEPYYLVAELAWDDMAALRTEFSSPLGQKLARDVDVLAELCPNVRSMVYELEVQ